ncbi:MAG: hypothetical protein PVJ60_00120 [Phycisphaerales bacterium]|jgi:hypothetical protein
MGTKWVVPSRKELDEIVEDKNQIESIKIKITAKLIESMIGTVPKNKKIFTDYVQNKMGEFQGHPIKTAAEMNEEIESVSDACEKTATGFHNDVFGVFIFNYMILGNIKANIYCLTANGFCKVLAYKKSTDLFVKINPRKIRFYRDDEEHPIQYADNTIERSIRAQTPKGDRVFLGKGDVINRNSKFKFEVQLFKNDKGLTPEVLVEALKFGKYNGLGQWRGSGGYGKYKLLSVKYIK